VSIGWRFVVAETLVALGIFALELAVVLALVG